MITTFITVFNYFYFTYPFNKKIPDKSISGEISMCRETTQENNLNGTSQTSTYLSCR